MYLLAYETETSRDRTGPRRDRVQERRAGVRTLSPTGVGFILPYWKMGFSLVWGMDWGEEAMASDSSRFTSSQLDTQR